MPQLPLFIQQSDNVSTCSKMEYVPSAEDEVEDLFKLVEKARSEVEIDAVCCGALLSDYQRIRVESVCDRLGILNLAPLWQGTRHSSKECTLKLT